MHCILVCIGNFFFGACCNNLGCLAIVKENYVLKLLFFDNTHTIMYVSVIQHQYLEDSFEST